MDARRDSLFPMHGMRGGLLMAVRIVFEDEAAYDLAIREAKAEALRAAATAWRSMQRTDDHLLAQWLSARADRIERGETA